MPPPALRWGMGRDRSLDEFLGGETDESAADPEPESADGDPGESATDTERESADSDPGESATDPEPESADDAPEESEADAADKTESEGAAAIPGDVEPAAVTYRWAPDGARCGECGASVDRLWSGESGPVCSECKEW